MGKTVLLLNDRLCGGGAEQVLQRVASDLAARGASLTIYAAEGTQAELAAHYPAGTRFRRYPFWEGESRRFSPRWFWQRVCRVLYERVLLRLRRWDRVVAMKEGPCMRLAFRLRADKKLAWVHTDYKTLRWTHWHFHSDEEERACMASFDAVVCVSETVRRGVTETVGDPGNLRVLYNPIDADAIRAKAAQRPADAEKPAGGPLFVAVGRLTAGKRYDLLLDVCRELSSEHRFTLWIVGGGEEETALRAQLAASGCSNLRLLGQRENPYPYIAQADWLLSASESESYGLTEQEALILGVPVLACACGGVAESLDTRFGILCSLEREALLAALRRVLEEPALHEARAEAIARDYDRGALWAPRLAAIRAAILDESTKRKPNTP